MQAASLCWQHGRIVDAEQASISVLDHGLLYGDGVFEGIRFYRRKAFRLNAHLQRLQDSARAIGLRIPLSLAQLQSAIGDLIAAFAGDDGYLRLVVTRGTGPLGLDHRGCKNPQVFIIASALQMIDPAKRSSGASVIISSTRRLRSDGLDARIKSLNYLNHILARMEASHAGADEAVLLNDAGRVAEGSADNIFIVKNGVLLTPPVTEGALDGITRRVVLEVASTAGLTAREIPLAPYDLYTADECFLTGTGAELIPVRDIDGRAVSHCPGPVFRNIETQFRTVVEIECGSSS